jgi:hypothetical protein
VLPPCSSWRYKVAAADLGNFARLGDHGKKDWDDEENYDDEQSED